MATLPLPRRLVLLRHLKSSWDSEAARDFDRPLAERGLKAAPSVGQLLTEHNLLPEWVLCSPAARTRATWSLVAPALGLPTVEVFDPALYLASARTLLARVHETPQRISSLLLIGHNPGLQDLASELAEASENANPDLAAAIAIKFPTGAVLAFELGGDGWQDLGKAPHRLVAWRTPKGREPFEF